MPNNNSQPDKDLELSELVTQYEKSREESRNLYLDSDQLVEIAEFYANYSRLEEAQEVLTYGLQLHPKSTNLLIEQAYLHLDKGDIENAEKVADLLGNESDTEVALLKIELLLNRDEVDEAIQLALCIKNVNDADDLVEICKLFFHTGYTGEILPWLYEGLEKHPNDVNLMATLAACLMYEQEIEKAKYYYNKLIDEKPYHASYWVGLGQCYFSQQNFTKAIEAIDFALAADEDLGEAHIMKAHSLLHLENHIEAIASYQKALEYEAIPIHYGNMFMGLAHCNIEQWEEAESCFRASLAEFEENKYLEKIDPGMSLEIYTKLTNAVSKQGKHAEAIELCKKMKEIYPHKGELLLQYGSILLAAGKYKEGYKQWALVTANIKDAGVWQQLGTECLEVGQIKEALFYLKRAYELDSNLPRINEQLAVVYLYLEDLEKFHKHNLLANNPVDLSKIKELDEESENENEQHNELNN